MKRVFAGAIILMVISAPVYAESVPRYDVSAHCTEVSNVSGGSNMIYNGCVDMEQTAYDSLKRVWNSIPSSTRAHCDDVARVTGGSYSILEGCIQMETQAAGNTSVFEY